jgi:hypothetical protein
MGSTSGLNGIGIKHACDEENRRAGELFLEGLADPERERLDAEFLTRYGDVPQLHKRLENEGFNSPLVRSLYFIFCARNIPRKTKAIISMRRVKGRARKCYVFCKTSNRFVIDPRQGRQLFSGYNSRLVELK